MILLFVEVRICHLKVVVYERANPYDLLAALFSGTCSIMKLSIFSKKFVSGTKSREICHLVFADLS